jgi:hypothetical protein
MNPALLRAAKILAVVAGAYLILYCPFVHFTDSYHVAIVWNRVSGELSLNEKGGFHLTPPWTAVARIDTRPMRVCITSTARTTNCKLVEFQPAAYRDFVSVQGFHYYWWANRFSWNSGYNEEYRGMRDILRGYAFSARQYTFVRVSTITQSR